MAQSRTFDMFQRHICRSSILFVIVFLLYPSSCSGGRPEPTDANVVQHAKARVVRINVGDFNGTMNEIQHLPSAPVEFMKEVDAQRKMLKSAPKAKQTVQPANPLQATSKFIPQIWWSKGNGRVLMQGVRVSVKNVGKKVVTGFVCNTNAKAGIRAGADFYFPEGNVLSFRTILLPNKAAVVDWYVQVGPRVQYTFKCSATTYY
eukprot:jgi/Mesen1/1457/ME000132S00391